MVFIGIGVGVGVGASADDFAGASAGATLISDAQTIVAVYLERVDGPVGVAKGAWVVADVVVAVWCAGGAA